MSNPALTQKLANIRKALEGVPGVYLHDIRNFVNGQMSVNRKGELKLPLSLPADEVLPSHDLGHILRGEWKVVPILMFIETADTADKPSTTSATSAPTSAPAPAATKARSAATKTPKKKKELKT